MDYYKAILAEALSKAKIKVKFENLKTENPNEIVDRVCYNTILRIRGVLDNEELDDFECIERIVCLLENIGLHCGFRHDF